jgi:hypothetical protein
VRIASRRKFAALRRAAMPAAVFVLSLFFSVVVSRATRPPGYFTKYLVAVRDPASIQKERALDYSPLYLALARLAVPLGAGEHGGAHLLLDLQCLLFAGACAVVADAVRSLADERWGLAAGAAMAAYRPLLVYCGVLEPEILLTFLLAAAIWAGIAARRAIDASRRRWVFSSAAAGCALGLAALDRPTSLLLVPVWAVWVLDGRPLRSHRAGPLALAAAFSIVLSPVVLQRWRATGSALVMDPGPVFYAGNGPEASDYPWFAPPELVKRLEEEADHAKYSDYIHVGYRRVAAASLGHSVTPGESNRYWAGLAVEAIRHRPISELRRLGLKALLALSPYESHDLIDAEEIDRRLRPALPWGLLLLAAGAPWLACVSARERRDLAGPLALAALTLAVQVATYSSARQRLPLALALFVALPVAGFELWRRGWRRLLAAGAAAGVAAGLAVGAACAPYSWFQEVGMVSSLGRRAAPVSEGLAEWLDGRALRPGGRESALRLEAAKRLYLAGRFEDVAAMLGPVLDGRLDAIPWTAARAHYWQARTLEAGGRNAEAAAQAQIARSIRPEDLRVAALQEALSWKGRPEREAESWRPPGIDPVSAKIALARELSYAGMGNLARRLAGPVARAFPEIAGKPWP